MTYLEARNIIFKVFNDAWAHHVVWEDVRGTIPAADVPWARVTLDHMSARQSSINGQVGCRRYDRRGVMIAQIFAPVGDGRKRVLDLAQLVTNAYEDARTTVWFRNVRIREAGQDGNFQQVNVIVDFEYETVR